MSSPSRPQLLQVAVEAARAPTTVRAVLAGKGNAQSRAAVLAAVRRLALSPTHPIVMALASGSE